MSFGKMNTFISIVEKQFTQDDEGFKTETDVTVAEVRAYREGRHGSEKLGQHGILFHCHRPFSIPRDTRRHGHNRYAYPL